MRWGWSLWAGLLIPAAVIWVTAFIMQRRWKVRAAAFLLACFSFWALAVFHANHIQHTKYVNMQTAAEQRDWSTDTWKVFAPITAIVYAIVYCSINAVLAYSTAGVCHWWQTRRCQRA